MFYLNVNKYVA